MKTLFYIAFCAMSFTSCILFEGLEDAVMEIDGGTTKPEKPTKQALAEDSVAKYVQVRFSDQGTYSPLTFGSLYVLKPQEIQELDQLIQLRKELPNMRQHYGKKLDSVRVANDTAIEQKKRYVKEHRIYPTYEINHLFHIKGKKGNKIVEYTFTLYPNYKVKNVSHVFGMDMSKEQDNLFEDFITQTNVFFSEDIYLSKRKNKRFYEEINTMLVNASPDYKEDLLPSILTRIKYAKQANEFIPDHFTNVLIVEHFAPDKDFNWFESVTRRTKLTAINRIEPVTEEFPTQRVTVIGYKKFIEIKTKNDANKEVFKVLYFEFDTNLVLAGVLDVEAPYEQYFE